MKKLYLNMVLALTVAVTSFGLAGITAKAETQTVDWSVTYTGSSITSTYDRDKAAIENTMPGDTISYSVEFENASKEAAEFYMSADVVKTLEEGSRATGGAYSYKITSSLSNTPLFDSQVVGGDAGSAEDVLVGLEQVNGSKSKSEEAYLSLGTVDSGAKGTVTVTVVLDGNSQSNIYMNTLGTLEIKFGAQPVSNEKLVEHKKVIEKLTQLIPGETEIVLLDGEVPVTGGNPKTGDSVFPLVLCGCALLIGLLFIFMYFKMTKEEKEEVA